MAWLPVKYFHSQVDAGFILQTQPGMNWRYGLINDFCTTIRRQGKAIKTKKVYVLKRKPFFAGAEGRN
jgi:hypothetical protein